MKRVRLFGLALVAMFALSAAAAAVAQATEGPFWSVGGSRLLAGETREVKAKAKKEFVLRTKTTGTVIKCTGTSLASGATINGSTGANAGTSREVILYTGCSVAGNGTGCEVLNNTITTNTVENILGFATSGREGPLLILFKPVSGTNFVTVKFTAKTGTCTLTLTPVSGTAVGEAVGSGENTVNNISFVTAKKTIWTEASGTLTETKAELKAFSAFESTIEGEAENELTSKAKWSVLP